jgi:hypothetical protein
MERRNMKKMLVALAVVSAVLLGVQGQKFEDRHNARILEQERNESVVSVLEISLCGQLAVVAVTTGDGQIHDVTGKDPAAAAQQIQAFAENLPQGAARAVNLCSDKIAAAEGAPAEHDLIQQVLPPDALPAYDTLEEAGVHGVLRAYECSHAYECGGPIAMRPDGKFVVGPVKSTYSGDSVELSHGVPAGWILVADYHTHPCNNTSHAVSFFSPQDIAGYELRKIVGFMGDLCTGDVHEFRPGVDSPNGDPIPGEPGYWLSHGRVVGQIQVDGKSQEPNTGQ